MAVEHFRKHIIEKVPFRVTKCHDMEIVLRPFCMSEQAPFSIIKVQLNVKHVSLTLA